ncbi:hypothetical protein [Photobacterium lutimaris]|nr:hypothetical protein [Photobacterium lutimaris]TDR72603.1 hypothetical protein DFP78_11379 [Photobacterium lutimaris]
MKNATMNFTPLDLALDTLSQQQHNVKAHLATELVTRSRTATKLI